MNKKKNILKKIKPISKGCCKSILTNFSINAEGNAKEEEIKRIESKKTDTAICKNCAIVVLKKLMKIDIKILLFAKI